MGNKGEKPLRERETHSQQTIQNSLSLDVIHFIAQFDHFHILVEASQ